MYGYQNTYGNYQQYPAANSATAAYNAAVVQQSVVLPGNTGLQHQVLQQPAQQYGTQVAAAAAAANPYSNFVAAASYGYGAAPQTATQNNQTATAFAQHRLNDAYTAAAVNAYSYNQQAAANANNYYKAQVGLMPKKTPHVHTGTANKVLAGGPSNLNSYESAVLAATTSFINAKQQAAIGAPNAQGAAGKWATKNPNYRGRFFNSAPKPAVEKFFCELCKTECAGSRAYKEHLDGQRHKKKEALSKGEATQSLPRNKVSFKCTVCDVTCSGQDTYNAHVRGAKHTRAVMLCKKMGTAVPTMEEPTIIPPKDIKIMMSNIGTPIPTVTGKKLQTAKSTFVRAGDGKEISVGGKALHASANYILDEAVKHAPTEIQALIAAEQNVQPVGTEFITEEREKGGKLIQYVCTLCDCKFSDPNAKEIHLKGRRHRFAYKQKVDPSLVVEMKMSKKTQKGKPPPALQLNLLPRSFFGQPSIDSCRFDMADDRHLSMKHSMIHADDNQLNAIENLVLMTEMTLKTVAEKLETSWLGEQPPIPTAASGHVKQERERVLIGVHRLGNLANKLLLKGDDTVDLVVISSIVPTKQLVDTVLKLFEESMPSGAMIAPDPEFKSGVIVSRNPFNVRVKIASLLLRELPTTDARVAHCVSRDEILQTLAESRRMKWFEAKFSYSSSALFTMRIIRDIRHRIASWQPLTEWTLQLLVDKALSSCHHSLCPADALRRVFEMLSSGILFNTTGEVVDPCEKEKVDALQYLTLQQKEDVTGSAQHALRLMAFNQLYKVLGVEKQQDIGVPNEKQQQQQFSNDRKRPMGDSSAGSDGIKKEKKDNDLPVESASF